MGRMTARAVWAGALVMLSGAVAHATQAQELRVCMLADNPPYSVRERHDGFDLDVAQAVAEQLQGLAAPVWIDHSRRIQELEESDLPVAQLARGVCDAVFSVPGPASDSLRGTTGVVLGAPYYGAAFELFSCSGRAPVQLTGLAGRKVAIQAATLAHFATLELRAEPVTFFAPEAALAGLRAGDAEWALLWGPAVGALLTHAETPAAAPCGVADGYRAPAALRWNLHVATRVTDAGLRANIDQALAKLRTDGRFARIAERHGVPPHAPFATTYSSAALKALGAGGE